MEESNSAPSTPLPSVAGNENIPNQSPIAESSSSKFTITPQLVLAAIVAVLVIGLTGGLAVAALLSSNANSQAQARASSSLGSLSSLSISTSKASSLVSSAAVSSAGSTVSATTTASSSSSNLAITRVCRLDNYNIAFRFPSSWTCPVFKEDEVEGDTWYEAENDTYSFSFFEYSSLYEYLNDDVGITGVGNCQIGDYYVNGFYRIDAYRNCVGLDADSSVIKAYLAGIIEGAIPPVDPESEDYRSVVIIISYSGTETNKAPTAAENEMLEAILDSLDLIN